MQASQLFDLSGQVALVTGASGGLGARFARVLAANGATVVLVARRRAALDDGVAAIAAAGGRAIAVEADVTDRAALAAAFDAAEAAFGTVTILVNNAGLVVPGRMTEVSAADWHRTMALNLDAAVFGTQEAAQRMMAAGVGGSIVTIASILAFGVQKGVGAYASSKAAVVQATRAFALELAPRGIRVNALAPGYITTDINRDHLASPAGQAMLAGIPMRRFGAEEDLDGPLLLLASPAGRFMTGAVLVADGGHMITL